MSRVAWFIDATKGADPTLLLEANEHARAVLAGCTLALLMTSETADWSDLGNAVRCASLAGVGAPSYFATRPKPLNPQDLAEHACINLRLPTAGGFHAWEFEKDGREVRARVDGQLAFNNVSMIRRAARAGFGLACLMEDHMEADLAKGALVRVLEDWCPPFAGYHLYYPSRRQPSAAFTLLVDALRCSG